jgi:hypothetical protein
LTLNRKIFWTAGIVLFLSIPSAFASIQLPNTSGVPTDFTACAIAGTCPGSYSSGGVLPQPGAFTSITLLGIQSNMLIPSGPSTLAGLVTVAYGTDNVTGHLDFLYQYDPTVTDFQQLTAINFLASLGTVDLGYLTSLAQLTNNPVATPHFVAPTTVNCGPTLSAPCIPLTDDWQPAAGNKVDFSFTAANAIEAGQNSPILVIRTLVDTHALGTVFIQDGGNGFQVAYDPTPEPASAGVLLGGLLGVGLFVARKFQVKQG